MFTIPFPEIIAIFLIDFFQKYLVVMKNIPIFASELSLRTTYSALVEAAFFVIAWFLVVIDCCTLTGSRFIALLSFANDGFSSLFLYHTFLISQMRTTVRNAGKAKHSTLTGAPCGAKSARIPAITVRAGKVNATVVQKASPDFQEQFLSFIRKSYPGIHQLRFRKKRHYYVVRGAFGPRELFSRDETLEAAASRFLYEVKRKVVESPLFLERYYGSLDLPV